ncbi:unnamed protein product, partial [Mesorhabditis spiculigera]
MWRPLPRLKHAIRGISACFIIRHDDERREREGSKRRPLRALTRAISAVFLNAADKFNVTAASVDESEGIKHLLQLCGQSHVYTWEEAINLKRLNSVVKINEGSFGEVYAIHSTPQAGYTNIIKVVPIDGEAPEDSFDQLTSEEVYSELLSSKLLTKLWSDIERKNSSTKCFIHLKAAYVVRGPYHPALQAAWNKYDEDEECGNANPNELYPDQVYIVFEYENGGDSLDHFKPRHPEELLSIICQIATALAAAEQALRFEHRDLHIGNVLVFKKPRPRDHVATVNGEEFCFHDAGVSVRIIDFTLARFEDEGQTHYHKLKEDDALFEGDDSEPHHQIYRDMKEFTGGNWRAYYPVTNRIWLEYLVERLCDLSKYSHNTATLRLLHRMLDELEDCSSANEFIHTTAFTRTVTYLDSLRDGNPR